MADIKTTLAAGSISSPYYLDVNIKKQLCNKTSQTPVFSPNFTLVTFTQVGSIVSGTTTNGYEYEAIVNVSGIITYAPCGSCCAKSQTINQQFVIPFFSESIPASVSVESGTPINALVKSGCNSCCSNQFVCDVPITLSVIAAT